MRLKVVGTGLHVPNRVETNADLAPRIGVSPAWIARHTGVRSRHIATGDPAVHAAAAARVALGDAGPPDLILNASLTPRQLIPDTSVFVQRELGLDGVACHSIHATCLSFLVAVHTAAAFLEIRAYRRILIVSSEMASVSRDFTQPESAALLGDGAGAVVVERTPDDESSALLGYAMDTWPEGAEYTHLRGAGVLVHPNDPDTRPEDNLFRMHGTRVYRLARKKVGGLLERVEAAAGVSRSEIDLVVPHQASGNALAALPRLGIPSHKVVSILADHGNCIAASMPMALAHAQAAGRLHRGDKVMLLGTGAGLSIAAAILRW